jgi:hypothetical protein
MILWNVNKWMNEWIKDSARFDLVFTSLDLPTTIFLQSKVISLASDDQPAYMSCSDRMAQLLPQAPGSLFVAFYNKAMMEVI